MIQIGWRLFLIVRKVDSIFFSSSVQFRSIRRKPILWKDREGSGQRRRSGKCRGTSDTEDEQPEPDPEEGDLPDELLLGKVLTPTEHANSDRKSLDEEVVVVPEKTD
jgi:hypothetical protein